MARQEVGPDWARVEYEGGRRGSIRLAALLAAGHRVRVLDNFSTGQEYFLAEAAGNPAFSLRRNDLLDFDTLLEAMKGVVARHLDRFAFREAPLTFDWAWEHPLLVFAAALLLPAETPGSVASVMGWVRCDEAVV